MTLEKLEAASILFSEIKGSTALLEKMDEDDIHNLFQPVIDAITEAIMQYDGTAIHISDDNIVALFRSSDASNDHALKACLAALSIQEKIKLIYPGIAIQTGISSGIISLDKIGHEAPYEYDATGETVSIAENLKKSAKSRKTQISKSTFLLVKDQVESKLLSENVYELIKANSKVSIFKAHAKVITPFVGRENEIKKLESLAEKLTSGQGQVAVIVADAGMGKSRLVYEFTNRMRDDYHIKLCTAGAHSSAPLFSIIEIFQEILGINEETDLSIAVNKIKPFIKSIDTPYALHAALALANLSSHDEQWEQVHPGLKRKYIFEVGLKILTKLANDKPLVLVVEDLHWVDSETENFLYSIVKNISSLPIFLLSTYRPSYVDNWSGVPYYTSLHLSPLLARNMEQIANDFLGNDSNLVNIKTRLVERTSGNPFFIEQMLRSIIDEGLLSGEKGSYFLNLPGVLDKVHLPDSIYAVTLAQVDRLPNKERVALQNSAVIGDKIPYSVISALSDNPDDMKESLNALQNKNFIFESGVFPESEFGFSHALFQEVVYKSIPDDKRKYLHARTLEIIESIYDIQKNDRIETLAHHAFLGEIWDKAFAYNLRAANKAFSYTAHRESIALYEKALEASSHLPETEELIKQQIDIYLAMHIASLRIGKTESMKTLLEKAMSLAIKINSEKIQSGILACQCFMNLAIGDTVVALHLAEQAYDIAKKLNDKEVLATGKMSLISTYYFMGLHNQAISLVDKLHTLITDVDYETKYLKAYAWFQTEMYQLVSQAETGEFHNMDEREPRLLSLLESRPLGMRHQNIMVGLGLWALSTGNLEKAQDYLRKALQYSEDFQVRVSIPVTAAALGCALLLSGDESGKKYVNFAITTGKANHFSFVSVIGLKWCIKGLVLMHDYERAHQLVQEGLSITERRKLRGQEANLLLLAAEIEISGKTPNFKQAKKYLNKAIEISEELNMKPNIQQAKVLLTRLPSYT